MSKSFFALFFSFYIAHSAWCQKQKISLREALNQVQARHNITFSYADDVVTGLYVSSGSMEVSLDVFFKQVNEETGLSFEESGGNIIMVKKIAYNLCAQLVDRDSGESLAGVQVLLNGRPTNTITDEKGQVRFNGAITFQDTVSFRFLGYDQSDLLVRELINNECIEIPLTFSVTTLEEVVVNYLSKGINLSRDDHSMEINVNKMALLPGETDGDVFLAIKNLPGISAPNGKAGNLQVRGSTTDQTLVLFDNIPIYHKGHYFGAISPYNPWIVENVKVYRSGFGPYLGGRVGGALELQSRRKVPDSAVYKIGLNSYYGSAFVNIPVNDKIAFNATTRQAYPGDWRSPKLEAINEMVFQPSISSFAEDDPSRDVLNDEFQFRDSNVNLILNTGNGQVFATLLDVDNKQDVSILDRNNNSVQFIDYQLQNTGMNLQWMEYWSPKFSTNVSLMRSVYEYHSTITIDPPDRAPFLQDYFDNEINDWSFKVETNYEAGQTKNNVLHLGYELNRHRVMNGRQGRRQGQPGAPIITEELAFLHAIFANYHYNPNDQWNINLGLRSNSYTLTGNFRLEPRVSLNYQLNDRISLKSSAGSYSQYISQAIFFDFEDTRSENLSWSLANGERPVITSYQGMLGGIWDKDGWIVDLEVYRKQLDDLFTNSPNIPPGGGDAFVSGDLAIYGADLLVRKNWGAMDTWISYSFISTEMNFAALNQQSFKTYYDQPHVLNITGTMPWRRWKFSAGWHFSSGVPDYSQASFFPEPGPGTGSPPDPNELIPSETNDGRFSTQHQLDVAVVYDFSPPKSGWKGSLGLSLLNVYDRDNLVEQGEVTFGPTTSFEARYAIGFAPNLMINIQW